VARGRRVGPTEGDRRVDGRNQAQGDGAGGEVGALPVCVPWARKSGTCVDDGQRYGATQP